MDTFVVRVWGHAATIEEPPREGLRAVRGVVEHVASGRSAAFRGLQELGALILAEVDDDSRAADPDPLEDVEAFSGREPARDGPVRTLSAARGGSRAFSDERRPDGP